MSEKSINYMARDFNTIKQELISLSKQYYPELADSFNDASVGSWFIDLVSAVGDDLNYYIDRCYNEQNINSAAMRSSVLNAARLNGIKVPGPKAATCEVELSVTIPCSGGTQASDSMSMPKWSIAPRIKQGAIVTNGAVEFEIVEDVDFKEQFNRDAVSNRRWQPVRNSQGIVTGYTVTKSVLATAGRSRIYKKVITANELKPFMEVLLPFQNIMSIEGVIFKETSDLSIQPETFEFYVNSEKFRLANQAITTYKFYEVNSLTDQYIFGEEVETPGLINANQDPHAYVESDVVYDSKNCGSGCTLSNFVRYYKGSWQPIMQKFITEYTDNGYLKIIFGSGTNAQEIEGQPSAYGEERLSKMVNNDLTGILPRAGWTMYVLYRDGGGKITNISPGALNRLSGASWIFDNTAITPKEKKSIMESMVVTNTTMGIAGVDAPSVDEIKYLTKYNSSAQNRCVALKDYELRLKMMPPKYGAPYRCKAIEENNKILLYTLGMNANGTLTDYLTDVMRSNVVEYLSKFKSLGDFVELRSGHIYNIQAEVSIYVEKSYNKQVVVKNVIQTIVDYFNVDSHVMGEDIFVGDLEKQISAIDGVANLIELKLYSVWGEGYNSEAPLPKTQVDGKTKAEIDLKSTNKILTCDAQGMFEIKDKNSDIMVRLSTI